MSSQILKLLFLGSIGFSLLLSHSAAFAQESRSSSERSSGDVVVPTEPGSGTSTRTRTTNTGTDTSTTRTTTRNSTTVTSGTRFSCQFYNGQYTIMYQPESRQGEYFAWANPRTLGGGWDAQKRCQAIAQRLESYRPDGLVELQTSVENGQNTLCVTTESNPSCRIVLTVPPEKDPNVVRNSVFQNLTTADNGQQTIGVNTYTSTGSGGNGVDQIYNLGHSVFNGGKKPISSPQNPINLKPFLDRADGGTGTKLRNGVALGRSSPPQTGNRLDPSKFR